MKKIILITIYLLIYLNVFCQLPPITGFDKIIGINDYRIIFHLDGFTISETPQTQVTIERRVYFIHGLGGSSEAWIKVSEAFWNNALNINGFPAREVVTTRLDYNNSTQGSLCAAADKVREDIRSIASDDYFSREMSPNSAFIIAHSQGGLVCRTLLHLDFVQDPDNPPPVYGIGYGGIVTVSSPLQGAKILNNRNLILQMAEGACLSLMEGPKASLGNIQANIIDNIINRVGRTNQGTGYACSIVTQDILPAFFSDYYHSITNDYIEGANWIEVLNNDINYISYRNMPKVAFYGVESEENLFWRTVNWFTTSPNSVGYFEANDDYGFYNQTIKPQYNYYVNKYNTFESNYNKWWKTYMCTFFWNPAVSIPALIEMDKNANKSRAWNKGVKFFERANAQWEVIIGARKYNKLPFSQDEINGYTYYLNDGVVIANSAANLPYATHSPIPLYGSSHMQVRNDANIKLAMYNLLNGAYGSFFETEEK